MRRALRVFARQAGSLRGARKVAAGVAVRRALLISAVAVVVVLAVHASADAWTWTRPVAAQQKHRTMHISEVRPGVARYVPAPTLAFKDAMELLAGEGHDAEDFRRSMTAALTRSAQSAFFFECAPVNSVNFASRTFEFVLVDAPTLQDVPADLQSFGQYTKLLKDTNEVVTFPNLGGDATLIAPAVSSGVDSAIYAHFSTFIRAAPMAQISNFWKAIGLTMVEQVAERAGKPVWLSTSGLGVYYLHVRLDATPKYYTYSPYRDFVQTDSVSE